MESKYLDFEQQYSEGKTKRFIVWNKSRVCLGCIKWYAPWRKYVWISPGRESIFDSSCLNDIKNFIENLMYGRALLKRTDKDTQEYKDKLKLEDNA